VKAVGDIGGSPTYAKDLADAIRTMIGRQAFGLFHVTNDGAASRYDLVVEMKRILGSKSAITSVASTEFPLPAPRPKSEISRSIALPARGFPTLRSWQAALADYLASW
jgi:dTDP-4-dehydrorhamnose reductase